MNAPLLWYSKPCTLKFSLNTELMSCYVFADIFENGKGGSWNLVFG